MYSHAPAISFDMECGAELFALIGRRTRASMYAPHESPNACRMTAVTNHFQGIIDCIVGGVTDSGAVRAAVVAVCFGYAVADSV